jgi:hypothetical protein
LRATERHDNTVAIIEHLTGMEKGLVQLLRIVGVEGGHTITIYTSRKGRIWVTIKTWGDAVYASSAEVDPMATDAELLGSIATACMMHVSKILEHVARQDTWLSFEQVADVWGEVQERMLRFLEEHDPGLKTVPPPEPPKANGATRKPKPTK